MQEGKKKAEYRSSIRSKSLIKRALLELMQEKSFDKISVADIVRKADINRGTFYAHFKDPHDVLLKIQEDMFSELTTFLDKNTPEDIFDDPTPIFKKISEFLLADISYYRMLFRVTGIQEYLAKYKEKIYAFFLKSDVAQNIEGDVEKRNFIALLDFWISGVFNIYHDAILEKISLRLDEVPQFCTKAVKTSSSSSYEYIKGLTS